MWAIENAFSALGWKVLGAGKTGLPVLFRARR